MEKGVGAVPQPDWDSGRSIRDDEGLPLQIAESTGRRKRPVKSPSFHSRGGFDDLDGQTREEAIEDGLGLNSLEAEFDEELSEEGGCHCEQAQTKWRNVSHWAVAAYMMMSENGARPVIRPRRLQFSQSWRPGYESFNSNRQVGMRRARILEQIRRVPASPESDVDEGTDEGDVEEMGTANQNSVPAVSMSLFDYGIDEESDDDADDWDDDSDDPCEIDDEDEGLLRFPEDDEVEHVEDEIIDEVWGDTVKLGQTFRRKESSQDVLAKKLMTACTTYTQ